MKLITCWTSALNRKSQPNSMTAVGTLPPAASSPGAWCIACSVPTTCAAASNACVPHGQQRSRYAGRAARALRMPDQALQRRSRQLIGVAVKGQFHGARFNAVVQFRGRAVIVDVLHIARPDAAFLYGHRHGAGRLFAALLQAHAVIGFAGGPVPRHFAVDVRAPGTGPLHLLHHEEPGAFGDYKTVAVA